MSFKPEISRVIVFNEALALLPSDPVEDPDENSPEARECRRWYKTTVAALLEMYHWNLATKRGTLASIANDRGNEWPYAFAKPSDMAYPVSVVDAAGSPWSGWIKVAAGFAMTGMRSQLFWQNGSTIYSSIPMAVLEYTSFDITEADFTTLFKDMVVLDLASRICRALTKDDRTAMDLASRAETERGRIIAHDLNRNQPTYGNLPTETEIVRGAGFDANRVSGFPLDPVANPSVTGY